MDKQTKETLKALSVSTNGRVLREYVEQLIYELGDISTVTNDPIETRQKAIQILKVKLLEPLTFHQKEEHQPETYE